MQTGCMQKMNIKISNFLKLGYSETYRGKQVHAEES